MKLVVVLFFVFLGHLSAKNQLFVGTIPSAPEDGIYDPENWLGDDARAEMVKNLFLAKEKRDAEVFVIISRENFGIDHDLIAAKAAQHWGRGDLWGVAVHVLEDPDSPRFFVGRKPSFGWSEEQERNFSADLQQALKDAKGRAARESDVRQRVQIGTRELCDELSWVGLVMMNTNRHYESARGDNLQQFKAKKAKQSFIRKLLIVLVPLLLLASLLAFFVLRSKQKDLRKITQRSGFLFPETSPRLRFQGPWSGGGDVVVKVGSKLNENGSRIG